MTNQQSMSVLWRGTWGSDLIQLTMLCSAKEKVHRRGVKRNIESTCICQWEAYLLCHRYFHWSKIFLSLSSLSWKKVTSITIDGGHRQWLVFSSHENRSSSHLPITTLNRCYSTTAHPLRVPCLLASILIKYLLVCHLCKKICSTMSLLT